MTLHTLDFKSKFAFTVMLCYFVPIVFFAFFVIDALPAAIGFWTLAIGWFLLAAGTLLVFISALFYEKELLHVSPPSQDLEEENHSLKQLLQDSKRKKEIDPTQDADSKKKIAELGTELESARAQSLDLLQNKEKTIAELQQLLAKHKRVHEDKDVILSKLQTKIAELTYEIKTLVQYSPDEDKISRAPLTADESSVFLSRCIDIAQQHTGAWSFNPRTNRSNEHSIDSYALDQRRLYQALSREKGGLIFLFSPKEDKVLYVNQSAKPLLNLSPENFIQDFSKLTEQSKQQFDEALSKLPSIQQTRITLEMKGAVPLPCQLGLVSSGLFKNHVIGVISF